MFRRKPDPLRNAESEIAKLRQRREALAGPLQAAEADTQAAVAERRRLLVEADNPSPSDLQRAEATCASTGSRQNALADAVAQLGHQIAEAENKLAADRTRAEREKAAADLVQRAQELEAFGDQLADATARLAQLYEAFRAAAGAKGIAVPVFPGYDRPPAQAAQNVLIAALEAHLPIQVTLRLADAPPARDVAEVLAENVTTPMRALADAIRAGTSETTASLPMPQADALAPLRVPEKHVALLEGVEWVDTYGGVGRALAGGASLPLPVAEEALRVGAAVPADTAEGQAVITEAQAPDVAPGARNLRPTRIRRGPPWRFIDVDLRVWVQAERQCLVERAAA